MDIIPAVNGVTNLTNAEFIKLTVYNDFSNVANVSVYTFSSSYQTETIDGVIYDPLGGLLAVGIQNRNIAVTSADTSVSLSGVSGTNIALVLQHKIKGSKLEIIRGFYDNNFNLTSTAHRFTGIVTSYNIQEERQDITDNYTITLNASSFRQVLQNRVQNRKTNVQSWTTYSPEDTSMSKIWDIAGAYFDFGSPVNSSTTNPSLTALTVQQASISTPQQTS